MEDAAPAQRAAAPAEWCCNARARELMHRRGHARRARAHAWRVLRHPEILSFETIAVLVRAVLRLFPRLRAVDHWHEHLPITLLVAPVHLVTSPLATLRACVLMLVG